MRASESGICRTHWTTVVFMVSTLFLLSIERERGWTRRPWERRSKKTKNTITCYFCFPGLTNQGDVDETGTQLSLTMIIVLCVVSLVAVAMICGTIVVVVMYKRWSAKHEARTAKSIIPPETRDKKPKVLKLWVQEKAVPAYYTLGRFFGSAVCDAWQNCSHIDSCLLICISLNIFASKPSLWLMLRAWLSLCNLTYFSLYLNFWILFWICFYACI